MKKNIILSIVLLGCMVTMNARTIDFETQDYQAVSAYDSWEASPFRTGALQGNCKIVDNPDNSKYTSAKVLGLQRSILASNQYGMRIDLLEEDRFELTTTTKYVHVYVYKPNTSRMMLIGLGKRQDRAGQSAEVEQFFVESSTTAKENAWFDAVFPIKGNGGIDIYSLVLVPDLASPHDLTQGFFAYCDGIVVNSSAAKRIVSDEDYATCFDKDMSPQRTDRALNSISLNGAAEGNKTITVPSGKVYFDMTTGTEFFSLKAGETVTPTFGYQGSWMSGYVYLDRGNDGKMSFNIESTGVPSEGSDIMAYSYYAGKNSKGASVANGNVLNPPAFKVPSDLANGYYRMRYKVDWNCIDPAGNESSGNFLPANGGAVVDALVLVHGDQVTLNAQQLNGDVQTTAGVNLANTPAPYGQPFTIKMAPAPGFAYDGIVVRYGYNLAGDSIKHGNRQWRTITYSDVLFDSETNTFTLPAEIMKNDVSIEGLFVDEKYKKKNVKVTYAVLNSVGDTLITEEHVVKQGSAIPSHELISKAVCSDSYYTLGGSPEGVVNSDTTIVVDYEENFPFKVTYDAAHPKKYLLMLTANQNCLFDTTLDMNISNTQRTQIDAKDTKYHWYIMGNAFTGFKLYTVNSGESKVLSSSTTMSGSTGGGTRPHMTDLPVPSGNNTYWFIEPGQTIQGQKGFYLGQVGFPSNRVNYRDNYLAYWTGGAGNGSTITIEEYVGNNVFITNSAGEASQFYVEEGDDLSINDTDKALQITENIPNVNVTYSREAIVGKWQAWYMPFDVDYADMSTNYEVAQIQGVMVDAKGASYVGFLKINSGVVKAHTPYVIRARVSGSITLATPTTLQPTESAKSFSIQSATHNFTFGGVYENSYLSAEYPTYALMTTGNFGLMSESVYLRPFRIFMRIADREDNPYAVSQEVKVVVLGDEETVIDDVEVDVDADVIYNLAGQRVEKVQKGVNIVNSKKVLF